MPFTIRHVLRNHRAALLAALFVGLLYVGPHLLFLFSLGDAYRGIPMMATANEVSYLGRIREIIDGHGLIGSFSFYEYKNEWPLSPPLGEWVYALPILLFDVPLPVTLIASKFILPFTLFVLVYMLLLRLTEASAAAPRPTTEGVERKERGAASEKVTAIAGAFLVVLGYDLVDYRSLFRFFFEGEPLGGTFLLWARPVNPIIGALFLFSFLLLMLALMRKTKHRVAASAGAGLFLALMMMNYVFSWGIAVSVLAAVIAIFLLRTEYQTAGTLALVLPFGALFSSPYWWSVWHARQSPWYEESALRSGLFYTYSPLFNKLLLAALAGFTLLLLLDYFSRKKERHQFRLELWHQFSIACLLGSLWALNQQIITGVTVWPFHFVQYSIPLVMVVALLAAHHILFSRFRSLRIGILACVLGASLAFGIYSQAYAYRSTYQYYREMQAYVPLLNWFEERPGACVVLVNDKEAEYAVNDLLLAFTHCDVYVSPQVSLLMPDERVLHNTLTIVRLQGVPASDIERYVRENASYLRVRLASSWQGIYQTPSFADFRDDLLDRRLDEFPEMYRAFLQKDFETELRKYRLDFIVSVGPLSESVTRQLPNLVLMRDMRGNFIYQFRDGHSD